MAETKNSMDDIKDDSKVAEPQTSRPIVVGNTNEVVDSTLVADKPAVVEKSKKVIKPLTEEEKSQDIAEVADKPEEDTKIEIKSEVPAEVKTDKPEKPSHTNVEQAASAETSEAPVEGSSEVDTLAGEVSTKRQDELAQKEQEAKQVELEKKIESKEYFLPIKDSKAGSKLGTALLLLVVVAGVVVGAGYYYMTLQK